MQTALRNETLARSNILAAALGDTIAELRLIDAGHMVAYIRAGQWANIADLVRSSAELFFADGTVSFAYAGDYEMSWTRAPSIALEMEFQTSEVTAFFTLTLNPTETRIRVNDLHFASSSHDPREATHALARAVDSARQGSER